MTQQTTEAAIQTEASTGVLLPAVLAILLGAALIFGTGFANSDILHNAAHDSRHSFTFPCH